VSGSGIFGTGWYPALACLALTGIRFWRYSSSNIVIWCPVLASLALTGIRFWHYSSLNIVIVFKLSRLADDLLWYLWRWLVSGSRIFSTGWYSILASWALTDILHWHLSHWLASGSGVLFRCNRSRFIQVLLTLFFREAMWLSGGLSPQGTFDISGGPSPGLFDYMSGGLSPGYSTFCLWLPFTILFEDCVLKMNRVMLTVNIIW
jgi:hypothetical protein